MSILAVSSNLSLKFWNCHAKTNKVDRLTMSTIGYWTVKSNEFLFMKRQNATVRRNLYEIQACTSHFFTVNILSFSVYFEDSKIINTLYCKRTDSFRTL